ncbi:MAG: hypothetical protein IKL68_03120, partial [Clostridia bacterium]|nr:hypothetical protein [Clostridia bacterium]
STAEYTIACDAIDKNNNPVYLLKAGMTKAEYDALGLKYRRGSWIFICLGSLVTKESTGYYSTGEILDTYAATIQNYRCPMFQVNGNGTISVNSSNSSISTNNSTYATVTNPYPSDKFITVSSAETMAAYSLMMFDGSNGENSASGLYVPFDLSINQTSDLLFAPGSLLYAPITLTGNLVLVDSVDGYNCYVVIEE